MTADTVAGNPADLRRRLAGLRAQACGMAHEAVAPGPSASPEDIPRPPLCASARRRGNLACTHSLARATLRDALHVLADRDPSGGFAADLDALASLDTGLCLLDHRRYDAETRMARARAAGDAAAMAEAGSAIAAAVADHGEAVAVLGALRVRALAGFEADGRGATFPEPSLPSPDPLRGPPSPAEGRGKSRASRETPSPSSRPIN